MKNLFDIKDKVIVITGGCGILGKNIANYLAEQGAKIVILDRVEEAGRELEAELNRKSEARMKKKARKNATSFLTKARHIPNVSILPATVMSLSASGSIRKECLTSSL